MPKIVIDMTMSLDGYVAGPNDNKANGLGEHGGMHIFDWYFSGTEEFRGPLFKPEPGANRDEVKRIYDEPGAFIFGRRTYDITDGWNGSHPIEGMPLFILTHTPPDPKRVPKGKSKITFVTDGIESAIRQAKAVAGSKDVFLQGASPGKQALATGLLDDIVVHIAPYLLGGGVRLFDDMPDGIQLEKIRVTDGPLATHIRYRVVK